MQSTNRRPIVFTATGGGYFRIWIVNLLLTIITLGIYSAWAKVRRLRYFYGHTLVDQSPFEFHGNPLALFKGRLIGVLLLLAYSQAAKVSITLWYAVVAFLVAIFPYLIWKSLRFRLHNSSYRGIRFGFDGTLGGAYAVVLPMMVVVVGPTLALLIGDAAVGLGREPSRAVIAAYFLSLIAATLLVPWFYFALRAYQIRNARLGSTSFSFDGRVSGAYGIYGKTIGLVSLLSLVVFIAGFALIFAASSFIGKRGESPPVFLMGLGVAAIYLVLASFTAFTRAMIQNYAWSHTALGASFFRSEVGLFKLWRIEFVNLVLTLLTLGFFWPFAVVRSMRYRIESVSWSGDTEDLVAQAGDDRVGATGEETADLFGFDIAL